MALKFLNKKGWHTGSLRNIENVWKAEQKHEAEQRKLEELRKQIQDEREKSEFRLLQEQAGLVPRQERLDFLYESGLAVGKGSSDGFKALQAPPAAASTTSTSEASSSKAAVPGALFEDKPQSANDTWRKLHSDPLLLIRQREQEALARIKNNPIKMAMIQKSVEDEKKKKQDKKEKKRHSRYTHEKDGTRSNYSASEQHHTDSELGMEDKNRETNRQREQPGYNRRRVVPKMSEEERAARLREMQLDAELHEEQRMKRLKRATEADAQEAMRASFSRGKNFLVAAQNSIYGAEKGGSATIEESVRRRAYYSQGSSAAHESNAFRR
ncbi:uncharacterized protein LOC135668533 [Musa acuminata AAA Group]|uniref:uncharacterized protein LOC135625597 n=1 Tax=Musa acuminata AAA Group TaxID=214697 RepID=UPI0031CEC5EE